MAEPLIIQGLCKKFQSQQVLDDVNITVQSGDVYGFLGPNGAGKSTTIRIIADLIRADAGSVSLFGLDTHRQKVKALEQTGMLIEKPAFYGHLSAETNLRLICKVLNTAPEKEIQRVLKWVDLAEEGHKKVRKYSQGMKQRLGIAQTLLGKPKFIILDEPTNGLDPLSMREIRRLILRLRDEGLTIFLSSHLLYEVERVCNRMGIIHKGKMIAEGSVDTLLRQEQAFAVELRVSNPLEAAAVVKAWDNSLEAAAVDEHLEVEIPSARIPDLLRELVAAEIDIWAVRPLTSLEDYFIHLVEG
jgi:ABC-2 type transport system ATP-binding protein